jgi:hypothetical protein
VLRFHGNDLLVESAAAVLEQGFMFEDLILNDEERAISKWQRSSTTTTPTSR